MAKLALSIEDLAVESFHTAAETAGRGTVAAAEAPDTYYDPACCSSHETACEGGTCVVMSQCCPSMDPTCLFTCEQTCTTWRSAACYQTEVC